MSTDVRAPATVSFAEDAPSDVAETSTGRPRRRAGAAVAVAVAMFGVAATAVAVWPDTSSAPSAAPGPSPTVAEAAPPAPTLDDGPVDDTSLATEPGVSSPTIRFVPVPEALQSVAPTEVVALSPDRGLVEISLPSGRVRTTDLRFFTGQARLSVTDFGSLVVPTGSTATESQVYSVIPIGGQPLPVVGPSEVGEVVSTPGIDEFVLWPIEDRVDTLPTAVTAGGEPGVKQWEPFGDSRPRSMDPAGRLLDEGPGGIFVTEAATGRRVSTGDLVSTGRNHILVHECDDERRCSLVTIDDDGVRTIGLDTSDVSPDHPIRSALVDGLAPDGSAVLTVSNRDRRELAIMSITDGSLTPVHGSPTFELNAGWAADSSGVFFGDGDLRYFDRVTGNTVALSDDIANLRAVSTRRPALTTACEFATTIVRRFERMRERDDVGAPSVRALEGLRSTGPTELATQIDALISFVDAFVSAQGADSARIENWPTDVRIGVEAIDAYSASECDRAADQM